MSNEILNASSPSPLYDDQNNSSYIENKKMISFYANDTTARPTLRNTGLNELNNDISNSDNSIKFVYELKIILLGPVAVGKTSIFSRYISNTFSEKYNSTLNVEYNLKTININSTTQAKLKIWDTCGQEKYRTITRQYYSDAHGILLVYDISNRSSFENINIWEEEIKKNAPENCVVFLVANKSDLIDKREVSTQEGKDKANELGYSFNEVSAKYGDNIFLLFDNISEEIIKQLKKDENVLNKDNKNIKFLKPLEITNKRETQNKKKKKCC